MKRKRTKMELSRTILRLKLLFLLCFPICLAVESNDCKFNNYDFNPLGSLVWTERASTDHSNQTIYNISLCSALDGQTAPCNTGTSVCEQYGGQSNPIGNFSATLAANMKEDTSKKELQLTLQGIPCEGDYRKTIIFFKCGPTLGSPVYVNEDGCETYFEWFTSVACRPDPGALPPSREVPCYVYGTDGKKRDLSPLIKHQGAHYVASSDEDSNFYINVCRDIRPDQSVGCNGTAACLIKNNSPSSVGVPKERLQINRDGDPYIVYTSESVPAGCTNKAVTNITFRCPKRDMGSDPVLQGSGDCQYLVLWETEYACPEDSLVSSTCKLTTGQHGVDIDLTPLKNTDPKTRYQAKGTNSDGSKTYTYYLNVCGDLDMTCPDESHKTGVTSCQKDLQDPNFGKVLGKLNHQKLRYSDRQLSLSYTDGDSCHTGFKRTTVIQFHCNKTAGHGTPVYNAEDSCTYIFDWDTEYACIAPPSRCQVSVGKQHYSLSPLTRQSGSNDWVALNGLDAKSSDRYYINVCDNVLAAGVSSGCPADGAMCLIDSSGEAHSLGKFENSLTYNPTTKSLELHYTEGSACETPGKQRETIIRLYCLPGDTERGPVLTGASSDRCVYEFDWQTAYACVLSHAEGTDCKVFDQELGFSFDLAPLTKSGDAAYYHVSSQTSHNYYINVCAPVSGKACTGEAGVCQEEKLQPANVHNTGIANGNLKYYDGLIRLLYTGGDPYNTNPPKPRQTEISFLCDLQANNSGIGVPEFIKEFNQTYIFRWFTKYACPQQPVECVVIDKTTNAQYDLSRLIKAKGGGNWEAFDSSVPGTSRQYYFNVCRPVNPVAISDGCGPFAGVCATQVVGGVTSVYSPNLGEVRTSPQLLSDGRILLNYTSGASCTENNKQTTTTTLIYLTCKRGSQDSHPIPDGMDGNCVYKFTWETEAACPVTMATGLNCIVKDPNSDFNYNLQHLKRSGEQGYYLVQSPGGAKQYKMNVCGTVPGCAANSSVCEGGNSLASLSTSLTISEAGALSLTYTGGLDDQTGEKIEYVIRFECDQSIPLGEPAYDRQDGTTHRFTFKTAAACPPAPVECQASDQQGNVYDLSPLVKNSGSWKVPDSRIDHSNLVYYINVCKPISVSGDTRFCPAGPIGGCQIDDKKGHNMGYIQGQPSASLDTVTIRYTGGEICHKGTPNEAYRSTLINFHCGQVQTDPVFKEETEGCEYIFDWITPAACPLNTTMGRNCTVTESRYHHTFDLHTLHKVDTDWRVHTSEYDFLLNVCGPLHQGQGDCQGSKVGACQTKPTDSTFLPVNAGQWNDKLVYEDGVLLLNYTGGKGSCHGQYDRNTVITFTCDHSTVAGGPLNYTEAGDCTYHFDWPTSLACMPFVRGECRFVSPTGSVYDLSRLTLTGDNYVADSTENHKKFFINVCTTLVHKKGMACPPYSAACMVDYSDPKNKKYTNIGGVNSSSLITMEGNHLLLTYTNGEICKGNTKWTSQIQMVCPGDPQSGLNTKPDFTHVTDCVYHFTWSTIAACPEHSEVAGFNCTVQDPDTNYMYDLSSLRRSVGYRADDGNDHFFELNVCGKLQNTTCTDASSVGSCQVEKSPSTGKWNAGNANSKLVLGQSGIISLTYDGGAWCNHAKQNRSTVFSFVCGQGQRPGSPVVVGESPDDCTYHITWLTDLACQKQVKCSVEFGDVTFDLGPLVEHYHTAELGDVDDEAKSGSYYVSLCRPLMPVQGRWCPPESAVCREDPNKQPISLGSVSDGPYIEPVSNSVAIKYDHGSPCEVAGKRWSSIIKFRCKQGLSLGVPVLKIVDRVACQYEFEWETNIVCPHSGPVTNNDCKYRDARTKYTFDLSGLSTSTDYMVPGKDGFQYHVSPCASVTGASSCGGAAVCKVKGQTHEIYGKVVPATFISEANYFKMLQQGDSCGTGTGNKTSAILFKCDRSQSGNGAPQLEVESECQVLFNWKTPLACPPETRECVVSKDGATYDLTRFSMADNNWNVTDSDGNQYYLNLCESVHKTPGCPSNAAVCWKSKKTQEVQMLGSVDSQTITIKKGSVEVAYSNGASACGKRRRRSDNASVKIVFLCGKGVGGPRVVHTDTDGDNCIFKFQWISSLACKEERDKVVPDNNIVHDPQSSAAIDLGKIFIDRLYTVGLAEYDYLFNLGGTINGEGCKGAAVCQASLSQPSDRLSIAVSETRQLYMEDGILEAVYTAKSCSPGSTADGVTTIIDFHCSDNNQSSPTFFYKSKNCHYVFDWNTPAVCTYSNGVSPGASVTSPPSSSTVGAIVGVFLGAAVLCMLAIVFHKAERRAAFSSKVKSIFCRRRPGYTYSYSQLTAEEATLDTLLSESSNTSGRYGSHFGNQGNIQLLHDDDSDEDDILLGL